MLAANSVFGNVPTTSTKYESNHGERNHWWGMVSSPKSRLKFTCSYGGKILPRPGDSNLKYVGGDTRMVAVPRDIKFSGLHFFYSPIKSSYHIIGYIIIFEIYLEKIRNPLSTKIQKRDTKFYLKTVINTRILLSIKRICRWFNFAWLSKRKWHTLIYNLIFGIEGKRI